MRLEGHLKMGYYPTPPDVVSRIRGRLWFPAEPFTALDPCAGKGHAMSDLVAGTQAETYGIELDRIRAATAKTCLDHTLAADFFRCRISPGSISLLLLNPPYADAEDGRLEHRFLVHASQFVKPGGVLVYIIPQPRLTERVARTLAAQFDSLRVWRFPDDEFALFRQIVVVGIKRPSAEPVVELPGEIAGVPEAELPPLPERSRTRYAVLPSPPVRLFRSVDIDPDALMAELETSPLRRAVSGQAASTERPPLPLHSGHVALLLAAGELDGAIGEGQDRHVVRGYVRKSTDTTHEEDDDGNSTTRETERFDVCIKTLSQGGRIAVLSGR